MKTLKNKIEELKQINLESFDINTLVAMQSEIKSKQNDLFDEIEKIGHSIKAAKVSGGKSKKKRDKLLGSL